MPVRVYSKRFNIFSSWHLLVILEHWRKAFPHSCFTPLWSFCQEQTQPIGPVLQHISVGVWCPWIKPLPGQRGCKDVCCLHLGTLQGEPSFLSLSCMRVYLFVQSHLIIKKTSVHLDKTKQPILLLFMLIFKQTAWLTFTITQKNTHKKAQLCLLIGSFNSKLKGYIFENSTRRTNLEDPLLYLLIIPLL